MNTFPFPRPIIVPLVNNEDEIIGSGEKLDIHQKGLLHRAFSVLIYNKKGEMLIHQRALHKYHSPGLWTNACCGHPFVGEEMKAAAERRLAEEMGIESSLKYHFTFSYYAKFDNGLIENEIDHVYHGTCDKQFETNKDEVADHKWLLPNEIKEQIKTKPDAFTVWFREIMSYV
jgi:isopentenyl-diphosphate Delta-isomerase